MVGTSSAVWLAQLPSRSPASHKSLGNYPHDKVPHDNLNEYHNGPPGDSENQESFLGFPNTRCYKSNDRGKDGGNGNKYDRDGGRVFQNGASSFSALHIHPPDTRLI
jgi:hypothetical protein